MWWRQGTIINHRLIGINDLLYIWGEETYWKLISILQKSPDKDDATISTNEKTATTATTVVKTDNGISSTAPTYTHNNYWVDAVEDDEV